MISVNTLPGTEIVAIKETFECPGGQILEKDKTYVVSDMIRINDGDVGVQLTGFDHSHKICVGGITGKNWTFRRSNFRYAALPKSLSDLLITEKKPELA